MRVTAGRRRKVKPAPLGVCTACGGERLGRWCHGCGEDGVLVARTFRDLAEDFFDSALEVTAALPRTLMVLWRRPSEVPVAQRAGDRSRFLAPVKLYLTASLAFFLFLGVTQVSIYQLNFIRIGEGPPAIAADGAPINYWMEERYLTPAWQAPRDPEIVAMLEQAWRNPQSPVHEVTYGFMHEVASDPSEINGVIAEWAPRVLWLLMPIHALLLWLLFGWRRLLVEHAIMALWAHALMYLGLIIGATWNIVGLPLGQFLALGLYQAYLTASVRGYYAIGWITATAKTAVHTALYLALCWVPVFAGFFAWRFLRYLPATGWES